MTQPKTVAVITARGQSTRLPDKHLIDIEGLPLLAYPVRAAVAAQAVDAVVIASDSPELISVALAHGADMGYELPAAHTRDTSTQAEALAWTVSRLDQDHPTLETVVCLLGNTVMVDPLTISTSCRLLADRPDATSVLSVWQAEDDHPYRAMTQDDDGVLRPLSNDAPTYSDTRRYPKVYYHDQGVWTCRKANFYRLDGPPPWTWAGPRPLGMPRPWWAGRDVDDTFDLAMARLWVSIRLHKLERGPQ